MQLYLRKAGTARPREAIRTLRGFERISLGPGEQKRVRFAIVPERDLSSYDESRKAYVAAPGEYEIEIGASSADIRAHERVTVR